MADGSKALSLTPPHATSAANGRARYRLIDFLRGLAAVAVLFWHYQHFFYAAGASVPVAGYEALEPLGGLLWPFYAHGHLAVQLFWVISGFVFAAVNRDRRGTPPAFFVNRFARLYPLHILTLFVVAALQAAVWLRFGNWLIYPGNTPANFLLNLAFASSWLPHASYGFNAPIWSVSIEVLVYGLFWLSLPLLFRRGVLIPALLTVMFAAYSVQISYVLLNCAACFFAGTTVFVVHAVLRPRVQALLVALCALSGLCLWGVSSLQLSIAVPLLCVALVLLAALIEPAGPARHLDRINWLGESSYGIYLWHFPIQLGLFLLVPGLGVNHVAASSPAFLFMFITLAIGAGFLSHCHIEAPARAWIRSRFERRRSPTSVGCATQA